MKHYILINRLSINSLTATTYSNVYMDTEKAKKHPKDLFWVERQREFVFRKVTYIPFWILTSSRPKHLDDVLCVVSHLNLSQTYRARASESVCSSPLYVLGAGLSSSTFTIQGFSGPCLMSKSRGFGQDLCLSFPI